MLLNAADWALSPLMAVFIAPNNDMGSRSAGSFA
jgi:hypothetical protein